MATEPLIILLDAKTAKLDAKLKKTEAQLDKLDDTVKKTDTDFKRMAATMVAGALAASAAIGVLIKSTAQFAKELRIAAVRNKETVEEMQAWAFAANTVGISLEKLGDIGKDTNEKIGEFLATGGGGFVDFIDVMKLTTEEGNRLAETFSKMSGTDVLQEMVKQMEAAGISGNRMSFALEGLASDTTDLIPLLSNGARELERLQLAFEGIGKVLSGEDLAKIEAVGESFNQLGSSFDATSRQLVADYADEIVNVIELMGFLGSVSTSSFNLMTTGWGNILKLSQAWLTDAVNGIDTFDAVLAERTKRSKEAMDAFHAFTFKGLKITVHGTEQAAKDETKAIKLGYDEKLNIFSKYTQAASIIQGAFFEDNKAIQAGIIVADTATGIMRAFATLPTHAAFAASAVVAATGVAALASLQSASKGGGSIPGAGAAPASTPPQQSFQPDEFSQDTSINVIDSGGQQSLSENFTFQNEGGSSADEVLTDFINDAIKSGRLTIGRT